MMKNFCAIFDWDGVVIDSAENHRLGWRTLAERHGLPFSDDMFKTTFGQTNRYIIPNIYRWTLDHAEADALSKEKEIIYRQIATERGVPLVKGVKEFLKSLKSVGIKTGVGSSASLENITFAIEKCGLDGLFDAVASMEDVTRSKPAPDVFLAAARKLGAEPENCVVFEDSLHGIEAASAAGMKKVAVATTFPHSFWDAQNVDMTIDSFESLSPSAIAGLWN